MDLRFFIESHLQLVINKRKEEEQFLHFQFQMIFERLAMEAKSWKQPVVETAQIVESDDAVEEEQKETPSSFFKSPEKSDELTKTTNSLITTTTSTETNISTKVQLTDEVVWQNCIGSSDVIDLNVGGKLFTTTRSTLTTHPESMLAAMFSGKHSLTVDRNQRVLIDRNPKYFELILEFLRTNENPQLESKKERRALRKEFDFFLLPNQLLVDIELSFVRKIGCEGSENGEFNNPYGICVDNSFIYVADFNNHRVQVFQKKTSFFVRSIGCRGSGNGQFNEPCGVAVDTECIYVADGNHRIQIFDKLNGSFLRSFGSKGTADGQFRNPCGVVVDESFIYVTDIYNHRIQIFRKHDTEFEKAFGSKGNEMSQFDGPRGISIDNDFIYVADLGNNRVQVFQKSTCESVQVITGDCALHFEEPRGVFVDSDFIYVTDSDNNRVQLFDKINGKFIHKFGTEGNANGQFKRPIHVVVDDDQYVYVSDFFNNQIQIFSLRFC